MEDSVKFSANVMLIDINFLNEIVFKAKNSLTVRLGRELPDIDLPAWLSYVALDAGLREGGNEVQVLLVHEGESAVLKCCVPAELEKLNGMACRTPLGEFLFASVSAADMVSCEQLYLDLMSLALDSVEVKRLMLIPFHPVYGNRVEEELHKFFQEKSPEECARAIYFAMEEPSRPMCCTWDIIIFSLVKAFGIKSEEL